MVTPVGRPAGASDPESIDWEGPVREAVEHLRQLIRIDTTNPPGNEKLAVDYLSRALRAEAIPFEVVESLPGRASLVARLRGSGRHAPLLLNGHLDVVPADAARWRHDPFGAEEHDGCIWGRGAVDMKNMVAMSLMVLALLRRNGVRLERDVIFAAVADEEAGSRHGARFLVEKHPELVRAEYVLNEIGGYTLYFGDAVFYPVQVAEKGICWFELTAEGVAGHGSMPRSDNAVVRVARAVEALGRVRLPQHNTAVVEAFLRKLAERAPFPQKQAILLLLEPRVSGTVLDLLARRDVGEAAAMGAMLRITASPTGLAAGKKINVIPSSARAQIDGRIIPGQTVESYLAEVRRVVGDDVKVTVLEGREGSVFDANTSLFRAMCSTLERHHPGSIPVPFMIPGFTDSSAYRALGATCYGFSPVKMPAGLSFPALYHADDERIPVAGFAWGLRVLYDLVRRFCGEGDTL